MIIPNLLRPRAPSPAPPAAGRARTCRGGRGAARGAQAARRLRRRRALFGSAERELIAFCEKHGIPVAETQAGKSATPVDHPLHPWRDRRHRHGRRQRARAEADVVLAVGTRLADFTTGSWALFKSAAPADRPQRPAVRRDQASRAAARRRRARRSCRTRRALGDWRAPGRVGRGGDARQARMAEGRRNATRRSNALLPSDAQVLGAVQRAGASQATSSSAPPAACRASCISSGSPARRSATMSNTAIPAWATRSPAALASSWRCPSARSSSCSATAPI